MTVSENLYDRLIQVAQVHGDKPCLLLPHSNQLTYSQLFDQSCRVAAVLVDCGLTPGDRVVAHCEKTPLTVALYLACLQIGAIYVPLNTSYTEKELAYFLANAEPKIYVGIKEIDDVELESLVQFTLESDGGGTLFDAIEGKSSTHSGVVSRAHDDTAAILYTSGTTGLSKGAMLTHGNLLSNALALNEVWGFRSNDVLLHALPIYHVHGLFVAIHCALLSGSTMIFHQKFDVEQVIQDLPNATVFMGVPTFYTRLLSRDAFSPETVRNMRLFISGSAPLTQQTFHQFADRTGLEILERYGMSETLMNTSNPLDGDRKAGTVGYALPGVLIRIADQDGNALPRGEIGGIELRGPNVFKGYWRMPEKTAKEFRSDGYFITGDMGVQDADGRISIVGREKDLVISGGLNVYPAEVETAIANLPNVVDVAVIGVPHPDFGEGVVAVIVPVSNSTLTTTDVREQLKGILAGFKQPQLVETIDELPRNAMGKIQKNLLRERFQDAFATTRMLHRKSSG